MNLGSPDALSLALALGGLAGSALRSFITESQSTFSRKSAGDLVIGALVGFLWPLYPLMDFPAAATTLQKAVMVAAIAYLAGDMIQNGVSKLVGFLPKPNGSVTKMLVASLAAVGLTACATAPPITTAQPPVSLTTPPVASNSLALAAVPTPQESPVVTALGKLADNPVIRLALKDADDTLAWVDQAKLPPLKDFRARQCPTAVKLAAADLRENVLALQAELRSLTAKVDAGPQAPEIILAMTKLKFGNPVDPQARVGQLKDSINNRLAAVLVSCQEIIPVKQINEVVRLAATAGLIPVAGPLAGPLGSVVRGVLP